MQIISLPGKFIFFLFSISSVFTQLHADELNFILHEDVSIEISSIGNKFSGKIHDKSKDRKVRISKQLEKQLSIADDIFAITKKTFLIENHPAFVIIARFASSLRKPEGYCGAGHEDYAILVKIKKNTLSLQDEILIQSCLKSISLVSDHGDDPRYAMKFTEYPEIARYQHMTAPDFEIQSVHLIVENGKLRLIELPSPDSNENPSPATGR